MKKKEPIIQIKINKWKHLSLKEQRAAASWLTESIWYLVAIGDSVHDEFTGRYP